MNILDDLNTVFLKLGVSANPVTPETQIYDLRLDSLGTMDMIMEVEDKFDITINSSETFSLVTMNDLINLIISKTDV